MVQRPTFRDLWEAPALFRNLRDDKPRAKFTEEDVQLAQVAKASNSISISAKAINAKVKTNNVQQAASVTNCSLWLKAEIMAIMLRVCSSKLGESGSATDLKCWCTGSRSYLRVSNFR